MINLTDPMGEEHNIRRTTRVLALMVVVRNFSTLKLRLDKQICECVEKMFAHSPGCVNHRAIILHVVCRSVFWDLYCAASERRETCEHSSEAKAFHDYVSTHLAISSVQICARSAACSL